MSRPAAGTHWPPVARSSAWGASGAVGKHFHEKFTKSKLLSTPKNGWRM